MAPGNAIDELVSGGLRVFFNFVKEHLLMFFFYLSCRGRFLDFEMDAWKRYRRTGKWGAKGFFINFVEECLLTFFFIFSYRGRFLDFEMAPGNAIDVLVSGGLRVFLILLKNIC
jgi:hypothetical protein